MLSLSVVISPKLRANEDSPSKRTRSANIMHLRMTTKFIASQLVCHQFLSIHEYKLIKGLVMCPDKQMEWFNKNPDWHDADKAEARRIVKQRWSESYAAPADAENSLSCVPVVCHVVWKYANKLLAHEHCELADG